ncbi:MULTISPECIES: hypothetical protein [Lysinibacillus]|uniref:hypothetical protein n=1 Tax=Lysinibacillus TaxID=400634 RepID=UPI00214AC8FB|nr:MULTISPECIES: hypothetical protein [Lysinibacillus]UUV25922.1 hypothetical protein NP781_04700 [Lysinibacillus sp. FN11]UYB48795.1 hypothetical protein OCI51_07490 [Lysinibacillus capsici]
MVTENDLLDDGFKLIGTKKNGLKLYARKNALGNDGIVIHKVTTDGLSLGAEFLEIETINILTDSDLV